MRVVLIVEEKNIRRVMRVSRVNMERIVEGLHCVGMCFITLDKGFDLLSRFPYYRRTTVISKLKEDHQYSLSFSILDDFTGSTREGGLMT